MSLLWLRVAVLLYGIAALAVLPAALYDRPRWRHIAIPATTAALLFHFVSLAEMLNAARAMEAASHVLLAERQMRGLMPGREIDPNRTGMIGSEFTAITTTGRSAGVPVSATTAGCNAGILARMSSASRRMA